jgi:hypothetical protein
MPTATASGRRRAAALLALLFACAVRIPGGSAQTARPREYEVKAAYLVSLGRFVEWPFSAKLAADTRFQVCVLGDDPFGDLLDQAAAGAAVRNLPVAASRIALIEEAAACHVVFIGRSDEALLRRTLEALSESSALTVSDSPRFAERGGMIEFVVEASRVRFIVNLAAAENAELELSSDLLRVAVRVLRGLTPPR